MYHNRAITDKSKLFVIINVVKVLKGHRKLQIYQLKPYIRNSRLMLNFKESTFKNVTRPFPKFELCVRVTTKVSTLSESNYIKPLKTKRGPLYLKTQSVPRCKHFSSRLKKPISLCCKWHKSLFVLR
jgi:hypothetical protein